MMCALIVIVSITAIGRVVFNSSPPWGEEAALFCLIWISTVSSSLAIRPNTHLRMEIIGMIAPQRFMSALDVFVDIVILIFAIFLVVKGIEFTKLGVLSYMPALQIKKAWLYLCIPITGVSMIVSLMDVYLVNGGRKGKYEC